MHEAIRLAADSMRANQGGPFGAVVVRDGEIVGRGSNQVLAQNDPTAHAEIVAIRDACRTLRTFRLDECEIYTSCEPCPMCLATSLWARIERVYFAANRDDAADAGFDDAVFYRYFEGGVEDRSLMPVAQETLPPAQRIAPFTEWTNTATRIDY